MTDERGSGADDERPVDLPGEVARGSNDLPRAARPPRADARTVPGGPTRGSVDQTVLFPDRAPAEAEASKSIDLGTPETALNAAVADAEPVAPPADFGAGGQRFQRPVACRVTVAGGSSLDREHSIAAREASSAAARRSIALRRARAALARPLTGRADHHPRAEDRPQARLELVVLVAAVIGVGRLADDSAAWLVVALLMCAVALGALRVYQTFGDARLARLPVESLVTPVVAAAGAFGAFRLVPYGLGLAPAILGAGALVWLALDLEDRALLRPAGPTIQDRTAIVAVGLLSAFLAFAGVAGLVPGGLVEPANGIGAAPAEQLSETSLIVLAAADAFIALLVGYRFAALRVGHLRPALTAALGYAAAIAIAAGLVRAAALPRLLGPAILTLVLFLWDAIRGASPATRRDPRFIWQVALIAVLGIVVVAWNIGLRH